MKSKTHYTSMIKTEYVCNEKWQLLPKGTQVVNYLRNEPREQTSYPGHLKYRSDLAAFLKKQVWQDQRTFGALPGGMERLFQRLRKRHRRCGMFPKRQKMSAVAFHCLFLIVNFGPMVVFERHLFYFLRIDATGVFREGVHSACIVQKALEAAGRLILGPGGSDGDNAGLWLVVCIDSRLCVYGHSLKGKISRSWTRFCKHNTVYR